MTVCRLVTRQDVKSVKLEEYASWTFDRIAEAKSMCMFYCVPSSPLCLLPPSLPPSLTPSLPPSLTVPAGSPVQLAGIMASLGFLFKHGKREDMAPLAPHILTRLKQTFDTSGSNTQLRKLHAKVVQQLGITFLPPRLAKWRYQRGARSLEAALTAPPSTPASAAAGEGREGEEEEEEEEYEVPPEVEEVLELLLMALQDRDTVVRWTAAKG